MKFAARYLRGKRRGIAFYLLACALFGAVFALYHLPVQAALYPALLCALLAMAWAGADICREYRRHRQLSDIEKLPAALIGDLPEPGSLEAEDYQRIICALCGEQRRIQTQFAARLNDMTDYYSLWAHQIKTPIAAMRLQLQNEDTALSRTLSSELLRIEQYAEMVMAYLRLDCAGTDYVFRECDLDALLRQCIRRFSGEFICRRLKLEYSPVELRVVSDEKWLAFVIEQILSNALKYTREGGIFIGLEAPATLCIRDTGVGVAAEDLPRIFENGFTGLNGRDDKRASGLGLHLCRRILNKLGHGIRVESVLGKGTAVYINLAQQRSAVE